MWRVLLILSILPLLLAMGCRWWFGLRQLATAGRRHCRINQTLTHTLRPSASVPAEESAAGYGKLLRQSALAVWMQDDPKAAMARQGALRFGMAVPPLTVIAAVFAVFLAKIPVLGGIAIVIAATALAALISLLGLGAELRAIARHAGLLRENRVFPRRDDEDAVILAATAHAWNEAIPPILRWLQR